MPGRAQLETLRQLLHDPEPAAAQKTVPGVALDAPEERTKGWRPPAHLEATVRRSSARCRRVTSCTAQQFARSAAHRHTCLLASCKALRTSAACLVLVSAHLGRYRRHISNAAVKHHLLASAAVSLPSTGSSQFGTKRTHWWDMARQPSSAAQGDKYALCDDGAAEVAHVVTALRGAGAPFATAANCKELSAANMADLHEVTMLFNPAKRTWGLHCFLGLGSDKLGSSLRTRGPLT